MIRSVIALHPKSYCHPPSGFIGERSRIGSCIVNCWLEPHRTSPKAYLLVVLALAHLDRCAPCLIDSK